MPATIPKHSTWLVARDSSQMLFATMRRALGTIRHMNDSSRHTLSLLFTSSFTYLERLWWFWRLSIADTKRQCAIVTVALVACPV